MLPAMKGRKYPPQAKTRLIPLLQESARTLPQEFVDEMGLPSYLHRNLAMRWVYWRRLDIALQMLPPQVGTALDFGCGPGVLLPILSTYARRVFAIDQHLEITHKVTATFGLSNVELIKAAAHLPMEPKSVDLIIALDVLEHVEDIAGVLSEFRRILSPAGQVIISGPTENALYKLGRRLAGFSGVYHHRTIYDVIDETKRVFQIRRIAKLFTLYPFFLVALCNNYNAG